MSELPTIYIETTIPSYLTARPSQDIVRAAHQQLTIEWWALAPGRFELYTSSEVRTECEKGDTDAAAARLNAIKDLPTLDVNLNVIQLSDAIISKLSLPKRANSDAIHMATAAYWSMAYLLTWNCRHLANPVSLNRVEEVCEDYGYNLPRVLTPQQLLAEMQYGAG